ncbi:dephospho-CoA kinase [Spiroplasma chinense]|uniref:Dephospho-CoA kinase n=1 Tax=Spiroplasma chinense TaxID=216932 RepID=A0A5B9Y4Z1_9MOLU|nr:dephospho-CoA kinase [Spiroplasma chinense]QEH61885.1 dephospho-CoA kinase [Spiroplasma chinense]
MRVIGVSGFIGAGKSTLLNYIKEKYNATVIEADEVSKEVINDKKVIKFLKSDIPHALVEGQIDRSILRTEVFNNKELNDKFTSIIWPLISKRINKLIKKTKNVRVIVVEAAIIGGLNVKFDRTVLLTKNFEQRIDGVQKRDARDIEEIKSISEYQNERLKGYPFNYVLENNGDFEEFYEKIDNLVLKLQSDFRDQKK